VSGRAPESAKSNWRRVAAQDGWTPDLDGTHVWTHPDASVAYGEDEFVYLGDGDWEDVHLRQLTASQRQAAISRLAAIANDLAEDLRASGDRVPPMR
jgi:hypothetical protein